MAANNNGMRVLKSCGFLVFRPAASGDGVEFLLMKHRNRYDLPKGHMEEGESEMQTACREFSEETGLDPTTIAVVDGFRHTNTYFPFYKRFNEKVEKTLVCFAGYLPLGTSSSVNPTEHGDCEWVTWNPPHSIQTKAVDILLTEFSDYAAANPIEWLPTAQTDDVAGPAGGDSVASDPTVTSTNTTTTTTKPTTPPTTPNVEDVGDEGEGAVAASEPATRGRKRRRGGRVQGGWGGGTGARGGGAAGSKRVRKEDSPAAPAGRGRGKGKGKATAAAAASEPTENDLRMADLLRPNYDQYVVHCRKSEFDVYIGRPNPRISTGPCEWGNPFKIGKNMTRSDVIARYEDWLLEQPALVAKAKEELKGKVLACWCAPQDCHGHVLARVANSE